MPITNFFTQIRIQLRSPSVICNLYYRINDINKQEMKQEIMLKDEQNK